MKSIRPANARMLCILALKEKDPRRWTRERLAKHFSVSKVTITQAINKAKEEWGVKFKLHSKSERITELESWGAFSRAWVLDNLDKLESVGMKKR